MDSEQNLSERSPAARGSAHDALIVAFLQGAKWWEYLDTGATMWPSDQDRAVREAERLAKDGTLGRNAQNDPSSASLNGGTKIHALKTWPPFYEAVAGGWKPFECRKCDRHFKLGDILKLEEWDPSTQSYTGRSCEKRIISLLHGPQFGIVAGWVVLGLATPNDELSDCAGEKP